MTFSTKVQAAGANSSASLTVAVTMPSAIAAGSLIVVTYLGHSASGAATCADNATGGSNSYSSTGDTSGIPSSTKHMSTFYCLNSKAASAGTLTITVTGTTSGTQFIQAAVYTWPGGTPGTYDASIFATGTWNGVATGTVTTANPPAVSGYLLLGWYGTATENIHTFSATTGAQVLDAASKTANQAAGANTEGVEEYLTAGTSNVSLSVTIETATDAGLIAVVGFKPAVAGITRVQSGRVLNNGSTGGTVTLSACTAGNLLLATAVFDPASGTVTPPTGFSAVGGVQANAGHSSAQLWMKVAAGGETSFVFSETGASQYAVYTVHEFTGTPASPILDGSVAQSAAGSGVNSFSLTYGSAPAASGELAFAFYVSSGATADSGATGWTQIYAPAAVWDSDGYYWLSSTGSAPAFATTLTGNASAAGNLVMALFAASVTPHGTVVTPKPLQLRQAVQRASTW